MDNKYPLVSVILPAYNIEKYIRQSLDSIFAQNYEPLEVIVVDDGSTDGTVSVIKSFGKKIKLIEQENAGPAKARNTGLKAATGEFIAFLDCDDLWIDGKLHYQIRHLLDNPKTDVVYGDFIRWHEGENGEFPEPSSYNYRLLTEAKIDPELSGYVYHKMLFDSYIHIITAVIRRSVIDKIGVINEDMRIGEDYEFWIRVTRECYVERIDAPLALYRLHSDSATAIVKNQNHEYDLINNAVTKWGVTSKDGRSADDKALSNRLAELCFRHGYSHYWQGDKSIAKIAFWQCIKHNPIRVKAWIYYFLIKIDKLVGR